METKLAFLNFWRAVIFIDELDAIGSRSQTMLGQSSTHSTVSQLLTCMDGLSDRYAPSVLVTANVGRANIFVIAATNNLTQIDSALRRSGRFDRVIVMTLPDEQSRLALIKCGLYQLFSYHSVSIWERALEEKNSRKGAS